MTVADIGIPLRVEIGQREMDEGNLTCIRRDLGKESKMTVTVDAFCGTVQKTLDTMQADMLKRSRDFTRAHIVDMKTLADVDAFYRDEGTGFCRIDSALADGPEFQKLKNAHAVSQRCLPFEDKGQKVLIGKSY